MVTGDILPLDLLASCYRNRVKFRLCAPLRLMRLKRRSLNKCCRFRAVWPKDTYRRKTVNVKIVAGSAVLLSSTLDIFFSSVTLVLVTVLSGHARTNFVPGHAPCTVNRIIWPLMERDTHSAAPVNMSSFRTPVMVLQPAPSKFRPRMFHVEAVDWRVPRKYRSSLTTQWLCLKEKRDPAFHPCQDHPRVQVRQWAFK